MKTTRRGFARTVAGGGEAVSAETFVFARGPWLGNLLPDVLGERIFPTRQEVPSACEGRDDGPQGLLSRPRLVAAVASGACGGGATS